MKGRKLTRVQPQETPTPEAVPVPVTREMVVEAVPLWISLRQNTWALCGLWDKSDAAMKKILMPSMMELMHAIRAAALENGGFGKNRGEPRDIYRAKYAYITGRKFAPGREQCTAITKGGTRCKNFPLIGEVHCHTPGHATEEERQRSWSKTVKWQEHFELMMSNIGVVDAYMALSERITHTREM